MASRKAAEAAFETASLRSLYIRVEPKPRSLAERRAVLHAIQKYGEIEAFKRLRVRSNCKRPPFEFEMLTEKKHPSSFISLTAKKSTADDLIQRSPLQFEYVAGASTSHSSSDFTSGLLSSINGWTAGQGARKADARGTDEVLSGRSASGKAFALHIFPSQSYKHKTTIRHSALHGPWPQGPNVPNTFTRTALAWAIPRSYDADGLRDWQSSSQLEDGADMLRLPISNQKLDFIHQRKARAAAAEQEHAELKSLLDLLSPSYDAGQVASGSPVSHSAVQKQEDRETKTYPE